jgi:hypothetical protein
LYEKALNDKPSATAFFFFFFRYRLSEASCLCLVYADGKGCLTFVYRFSCPVHDLSIVALAGLPPPLPQVFLARFTTSDFHLESIFLTYIPSLFK